MAELSMTKPERETFLADLHVGVLCVSRPGGGAPIAAPVWYGYEPGGDVVIMTGREHEKTQLARDNGEATLCTQTESLPYRYVTVSGPVTIEDSADPGLRRRLADRYLGEELGEAYVEATEGEDSVTLRLHPQRWRTTDYSKM